MVKLVCPNNGDSDQIFYVKGNQILTYSQLWKLVNKTKAFLKKHNVHNIPRVCICCEDSLNFIIVLLSVISLGSCGVLIEKGKKDKEILDILNQANCKLIIKDGKFKLGLEDIDYNCVEFDINLLSEEAEEEFTIDYSEDVNREACIIYTSGSTGNPKGIIRTRKMIFEHASALTEAYSINKRDSVLLLVQLQHAYGLEHILAAIFGRATIITFDDFPYHEVISIINEKKCTIIVGVPYQYEILSRLNADIKNNTIRILVSASAPLDKNTNIRIHKQVGIPISQLYGSSELAATTVNISSDKYESVGKPISGVQLRIVDEDGRLVSKGEIGELIVKSPYCVNNLVNEEDSKIVRKNQWLYTGDLAFVDEDSDLFIVGRKKNIINIAGKKASPEEIEKVIKKYVGVKDVMVKGEKHPLYGEVISATIVTENMGKIDQICLMKHCREYLSDYKIPSIINYADKLNISERGKLQR
ncbi:class I adenylate-forming enzyme family protein [Clostridium sporogenes]|uniref:class I adenylate-forming enzyme family protein n=1 Tax=Clostridium sporogenes TaxID=1509 RepID=UPI0022374A36|nr:class I adenylate-forming enzyme family protein [Clostridium sporogenes]MCW6109111.1 acyl--CoA ligase [Clostridium sporogenes]